MTAQHHNQQASHDLLGDVVAARLYDAQLFHLKAAACARYRAHAHRATRAHKDNGYLQHGQHPHTEYMCVQGGVSGTVQPLCLHANRVRVVRLLAQLRGEVHQEEDIKAGISSMCIVVTCQSGAQQTELRGAAGCSVHTDVHGACHMPQCALHSCSA